MPQMTTYRLVACRLVFQAPCVIQRVPPPPPPPPRLSHGPLFSPLALAVPATQTRRGSVTQGEASACQGCSDQAHRESEPLIITFNGSSQRELRRASLDRRPREASFRNLRSSRYPAGRSRGSAKVDPRGRPVLTCRAVNGRSPPEDEWFNH